MVAVCGSYLFACGKTSNMQLSQTNKYMSLQAIWLDVNWSMTDPIYSVSRWLIFFYCCIWHTRNCFSIFFFFFFFFNWRECLHLCYIQNTPRVVLWQKVSYDTTSQASKQARQTFHCFILNSHFIQLSECKYVLFVCLSVWDFLYAQLIYRRKVIVPPILWFSRKRLEIIFQLKSAKNNPHVFATKLRKFGDAKRSHYTVYQCINKILSKSIHYF